MIQIIKLITNRVMNKMIVKPKMIITVGAAGSGKTKWAESRVKSSLEDWIVIARDKVRLGLQQELGISKYKHTKQNEKKVTDLCLQLFDYATMNDKNIIIADTNLNHKTRDLWKKRGEDAGYEVEFKDFPMTFDEILDINKHKGNKAIPEKVLLKQWKQWCEYKGRRKYIPDETKRKAIIVDIDNTIAAIGKRSPYDWKNVGKDIPRRKIINMIQQFATLNRAVLIFMTGRSGVCYQQTREWLCEHTYFTGGLGDMLLMRDQNDSRREWILKEELFWGLIAENYNVISVFESRPKVVDMWYDIGIENVICVADQRNNF